MKKIKIKKSVYVIFLIIIVLGVSSVILLKNQNEKNVEKSKETENETTNKVVEEEPKEKRMSLIAVGDILIHESVYKDAYNKETDSYDFHYMFTDIEPIIKQYDLKFCNQESAIGGKTLGISGYPSFNSPDEIGDELVNLGFNLISLANNHTLDRGEDAALYSNSYWKSKGVITAGSYSSMEERNQVNVYEQNGIKYAFLAYTVSSNAKVRKDYLLNIYSADKAKSDIDAIKDQVDVIIVSMHWGREDTNTPTESQKQIAEYLSSLGVNIVIGHHPHVVQPVEYVNDTLVIYSLGNFISNQLSLRLNNGIGLMYGIDIVVDDTGVRFENEYKELVLAYAEKSTNFKVIPFSKLNNELLNNYESIKEQYMNIVNGGA
ncbi:MAG: CapA family protein [Firmicutes bacterium]|nr:CapA family protein [Bacillota bacterium]